MKQAMILAAGLGTRLKPMTDTMPKALVPVGGKPLLWHIVTKLRDAGFGRIVVNVHHFGSQICDYLQAHDNFGLDISISDETSLLLETGGGIKRALPLFSCDAPVLIHNVDILSNIDLSALYSEAFLGRADALLLVSQRQTKRYLLFDDSLRLQGWTNIDTGEVRPASLCPSGAVPSPSVPVSDPSAAVPPVEFSTLIRRAFSGIHVLSPGVFPLFASMPERFSIIDFYLRYCSDHAFMGYEQPGLRLLDVGKLDSLDQAEQFL
jgi:NDP-sugar pyrophosphorylase family protein